MEGITLSADSFYKSYLRSELQAKLTRGECDMYADYDCDPVRICNECKDLQTISCMGYDLNLFTQDQQIDIAMTIVKKIFSRHLEKTPYRGVVSDLVDLTSVSIAGYRSGNYYRAYISAQLKTYTVRQVEKVIRGLREGIADPYTQAPPVMSACTCIHGVCCDLLGALLGSARKPAECFRKDNIRWAYLLATSMTATNLLHDESVQWLVDHLTTSLKERGVL